MSYRQFKPHPDLANYIDAYWVVEGIRAQYIQSNILPDGCVDLILNLQDDYDQRQVNWRWHQGRLIL
ncbi:DUF6597 domain-containing transcriptional factor [Chitinophaga pinensis]|uniref:DUF6597 domain-containing transcriptional factor n=1 Tax=Chitinophaga pinensis TaxID=79329 RepID=UPI0039657B73